MPQAASQHSVIASMFAPPKTTPVKPSRRKASKAAPGAPIVSPGQATQDAKIFALVAQIKAAEARWSAAVRSEEKLEDRFNREHPKPDIKNFAVDTFIDGIKSGGHNNLDASKFFEIGAEIRRRIKEEEKAWQEARDKLREETRKPCDEAMKDRDRLIEQLSDCEAATLKGVCGKIDAIDYDNVEGGDPAEISLLKSIFADLQALSH